MARRSAFSWTAAGVLAVSSLISAALGVWLWKGVRDARGSKDTVELVDQREEIDQLLTERHAKVDARGLPELAATDTGGEPVLRRETLAPAVARLFFGRLARNPEWYHPVAYYRRWGPVELKRPWTEHPERGWTHYVNSLGMRDRSEPASEQPDVRVLVTGDSHVEGVCSNEEVVTHVLEELLAEHRPGQTVEVLNAAQGGYNFYNYLGVLEAYLHLEPQVFVVIFYGGNDFATMMPLQRYFNRRPPPKRQPLTPKKLLSNVDDDQGTASQEFMQVAYFMNNTADGKYATDTLKVGAAELQRICDRNGVELLIVYLPPPTRGQPVRYGHLTTDMLAGLGIEQKHVMVSERLANRWLESLVEAGIEHCDLRPIFRGHPEALYWQADHHINIAAHRLIAETLHPVVERLLAQ